MRILVHWLLFVALLSVVHGYTLKTRDPIHKRLLSKRGHMSKWARTKGRKSIGHKAEAFEVVIKKDDGPIEEKSAHKRVVRVDDCSVGGPSKPLNYISGSWMNIFSDLTIDCPGEIMRWEFYARQPGTFWASIWRKVANDRFRMVGSNQITVETAGKHVTQVSPAQRIKAQVGDVIGIYHDSEADQETGGIVSYEDSRYPLSSGITADMLSIIHNSYTTSESVEIGTMVYGVIVDWVTRLPALKAFVGVGSSGGALLTFGYSSVAAGTLDQWSNAMYITDPSLRAENNGLVIGWNLYVERIAPITLQVWRPVSDNEYLLVGQTPHIPTEIGPNFISMDDTEHIHMQQGDTIGFYFPEDSVIPYSYSDDCLEHNSVLYFEPHGTNNNDVRVDTGDPVPFEIADAGWGSCRKYSYAAMVLDQPEGEGGALMMLGYDASPAQYMDEMTRAMYVTDPSQSASLPGTVVGWNLYVERMSPIRLQIWRPLGDNLYNLVGETPFTPETTGIIHLSLEGDSEIPIQVGDTLGFYFEHDSVIPFEKYNPCNEYNAHRYFVPHTNTGGRVTAGDGVPFTIADEIFGACRYYSYSAEVRLDEGGSGTTSSPGPGPGPNPTPGPSGGCGSPYYAPTVDGRIVGGIPTLPHSWPWMVSLQTSGGFPFCGGTLVNEEYVVTAAHCMPGWDSSNKVVLGMHNKNEATETRIERHAQATSHPQYSSASNGYDIAILHLTEPVDFTEEISPACLPDRADQSSHEGILCYTTGWGHTQSGGTAPDTLLQVGVPLVSQGQCNAASWYGGSIDETMICAGYEEGGKDSCQGDSGGPLVCQNSQDEWELIGVVSWGYGCASPRKPGVYAYVPNLRSWVDDQLS